VVSELPIGLHITITRIMPQGLELFDCIKASWGDKGVDGTGEPLYLEIPTAQLHKTQAR
jgi:hypothetical protein